MIKRGSTRKINKNTCEEGLGWEMLGDISYHKAILQSEGKHSIHIYSHSHSQRPSDQKNTGQNIDLQTFADCSDDGEARRSFDQQTMTLKLAIT